MKMRVLNEGDCLSRMFHSNELCDDDDYQTEYDYLARFGKFSFDALRR